MRSDRPHQRHEAWPRRTVILKLGIRLGVILALAVISVVVSQRDVGIAKAEQLPMKDECMVYEPNYCKEYEYYDQWEAAGGNTFTFKIPVMYDDPCDIEAYDGLGRECDWTGEIFQNHEWTLGVVELTGSNAVNTLKLAAVTGQNNGEKIGTTVAAIGCAYEENCYTHGSWLQSSVLGSYKNDHEAIAEGYWAKVHLCRPE